MTASGWSDDDLAWLQRSYDSDRGGHDDVVALIRGVRAVVALHRPVPLDDGTVCDHCTHVAALGAVRIPIADNYPCATILALALEV